MAKTSKVKSGKVTVTVQPVTRCEQCGQPVTYPRKAGAASDALTEHYWRAGHDRQDG